jgi:hypothetical protein
MNAFKTSLLILICFSVTGFLSYSQTTHENFTDGYYVMKINNAVQRVYVDNEENGLAAGIDHLTDSNRSLWIYQNKP